MSNIFLIGATGGVGSRLGPKRMGAGHRVKGSRDDQAARGSDASLTAFGIEISEEVRTVE